MIIPGLMRPQSSVRKSVVKTKTKTKLRPQLIVFDWDDTFTLGATDGYMACYGAVAERLDLGLSQEEVRARILSQWGATQEIELQALIKGSDATLEDAVRIYEDNLFGNTFVKKLSFVDGARDVLSALRGSTVMAVATGLNGDLLQDTIMPKFGVDRAMFSSISSVYDLEDHTKAKPHPHMLERIMQTQSVSPQDTIMVGDSRGDMLMARAAGVEPVAVLTGHLTRQEAEELNIEYILETVADLPSILDV